MLRIALDRDAPPHHEPNEAGKPAARDRAIHHRKKLFPFIQGIARGVFGGLDGSWMSLMPLMRSTPVLDARSATRGSLVRSAPIQTGWVKRMSRMSEILRIWNA
jgi:hypothetical protein